LAIRCGVRKGGAYLLLLTAVQAVANQLIKRAVGRPRPLSTLVDVFMPMSLEGRYAQHR
jgi:hypothetical protein